MKILSRLLRFALAAAALGFLGACCCWDHCGPGYGYYVPAPPPPPPPPAYYVSGWGGAWGGWGGYGYGYGGCY